MNFRTDIEADLREYLGDKSTARDAMVMFAELLGEGYIWWSDTAGYLFDTSDAGVWTRITAYQNRNGL